MSKTPILGPLTLAVLGALALAGAARAEPTSQAAALMAAVRAKPAVSKAITLPDPASRYTGERPVRIAGVAKTAVDYRSGDDITGSLGFLCGIKPGAEKYAGMAAYGYDPMGRFLGAKLSIALK